VDFEPDVAEYFALTGLAREFDAITQGVALGYHISAFQACAENHMVKHATDNGNSSEQAQAMTNSNVANENRSTQHCGRIALCIDTSIEARESKCRHSIGRVRR